MKSNTRKVILNILPGVFLCISGIAGPSDTLANEPEKPVYFIRFKDQPHFTFEFARRRQEINLVNPANDALFIRYEPNTRTNFIASFDYRWISLSLGLFSFPVGQSKFKGSTDQFNLRFSFNGKRIWNTNFIQFYQGYSQTNPQVSDSQWAAGMPLPYRPDINSFTLFSNVLYCFRPDKFSYRAALWQLDRQERSAGSFVAGASYRLNLIDSDTNRTMIPVSLYDVYSPVNRAVSVRQSTFTIHAGYIHTFVSPYKPWFLTVYLLPGIAFESGFYRPEDLLVRSFRQRAAAASEFRLIVGYNADRWFSGISFHSLSFSGTRDADLWVDNNFSWIRIFGGFRLNQVDRTKGPKFLRGIGL